MLNRLSVLLLPEPRSLHQTSDYFQMIRFSYFAIFTLSANVTIVLGLTLRECIFIAQQTNSIVTADKQRQRRTKEKRNERDFSFNACTLDGFASVRHSLVRLFMHPVSKVFCHCLSALFINARRHAKHELPQQQVRKKKRSKPNP